MSPAVRNILAIILGIVLGSLVNIGILNMGAMLFPFPESIDKNDAEAVIAYMQTQPTLSHMWIVPLMAHMIGTVVGAIICSRIAIYGHFRLAMGVGIFFLVGGIMNKFLIPHPLVMSILDIALYIPAAWLGWKLAGSPADETNPE